MADAGALALFAVSGAAIAEARHVSAMIVILMGTITGCAGGMLRDALCAEIPLILRRDIYATAVITGCAVYIAMGAAVQIAHACALNGDRANVRRYATVDDTEGLAPGKLTSRAGGLSGTPQTLDHVMLVSASTPAPRVAVSADVSDASDEDNAGQVLGLTAGVLAAIVLIAGAIGLIGLVWHH